MMTRFKTISVASLALLTACTFGGCSASNDKPTSQPARVNPMSGRESSRNVTPAINPADAKLLAIHLVPATAKSKALVVSSSAFKAGGEIPYRNADYGDRYSPELSWLGAPPETKSFVLLMEDPDAKLPKPFIHWALYNIPANTTTLRPAVPTEMQLAALSGARQGPNSRGSIGYMGPRPPYDDPAHHYHFQVFALDKSLDVPLAADRALVLNAMKGHVLASGELIGTYRAVKE